MSDPRFARLKTDPRFRRPKKKRQKVVVDDRFKSVFEHPRESRVDKYGRHLPKNHGEDNLKRYYRLAHEPEDDEQERQKAIDYARGEVLLQSSDEEEDQGQKQQGDETEHSSSSDLDEEVIRIGGEDSELEIDLDENTYAELDAQVATFTQANKELSQAEEKEDVGIASRTRRLAIVNLDWDHVRASHLYKIFSSLVSFTGPYVPVSVASATVKSNDSKKTKSGATSVARGTVVSVCVYPSEFGRVRMEREEKEGPPPEIFRKKHNENTEINERTIYEVGNEDDYDEDALRRYQLERLRYYYAIAEFDTVEAASHVYNELEGTELERTANVFDLSFVPDDMTFDVEPRDKATQDVPANYKPVEYVTDALRHSKVKLTWDEDDPERYQVTRRQFTRQEIEEADFRAYIASSSSEDEDENEQDSKSGIKKTKNDREASLQKLRVLLLSQNDEGLPEGWGDAGEGGKDVDMEITFIPGLNRNKSEDETTLEQYQRKMREKRKKKKEEHKAKTKVREEKEVRGSGELGRDEFFDFESDGDGEVEENQVRDNETKVHGRILPPRKESAAEELALIATSDSAIGSEPKHFNMKAILKAEKREVKKGKKGKNQEEDEVQEDFKIDVNDQRFRILHEDHQFAIDPTNPHYKRTKAMKALLEERQKRTRARDKIVDRTSGLPASDNERSLKSLVDSVKRKTGGNHNSAKRRRL